MKNPIDIVIIVLIILFSFWGFWMYTHFDQTPPAPWPKKEIKVRAVAFVDEGVGKYIQPGAFSYDGAGNVNAEILSVTQREDDEKWKKCFGDLFNNDISPHKKTYFFDVKIWCDEINNLWYVVHAYPVYVGCRLDFFGKYYRIEYYVLKFIE